MRNKVLFGCSLFLVGVISLLCTCKEIPSNPYEDEKNLEVSMFMSGGLLEATAGDSVSVGLIVNIPNLVNKLTVIQGDDQKELTVPLKRPESLQPDTVYFKTMYKLAGKKELTVNAALGGEGIKKTFLFPIRVLESSASLWKQDTMTLAVQEDTTISYSLVSFLRNPSATNIVFSSSETNIIGASWKYTVPWGAASKDSISLIASNGSSEKSELKIFLVVSSKDTEGPQIALLNPTATDAIVSDSVVVCKFAVTDKQSGVGTIVVKNGTVVLTDTLRTGSTFQCTVTGLKKGEKTTVNVEASDKSMRKNSSTLQLQLTYDPLMQDNVQPELRCRIPVGGSATVATLQTSIEVVAVDRNSGIDSVWAFRGTTRLPVVQNDSIYSVTLDNLVPGKTDTVIFKTQDKSSLKNTNTLPVYITCEPTSNDKTGPAIKLSSPAQDRSKVAQSSATLVVLCKDESGISAVNYTFGTLSGAMTKMNDSTYSVALANLVEGDNQIVILATDASSKKNTSDTLYTIVCDPTMSDNTAPEITLKAPAKDNATVSSKSITIEVVCSDFSGVDTVTCRTGTSDVPVVKGVGGVYSISVSTLTVGENTFTFTATDKASTKHSASKAVTVVYDPSMTDNVPPTVLIKNPLNADQRVLADTITVQIDCSDDSRVSSVTATRAGVALTGITNAGSLYSLKVANLRAGKSDTINFKVFDSSSNKNVRDFPVILRYNRNPIAATLGTPDDAATGVAKSPTFTWSDGTDPDGDVVTYTLRYGTSDRALIKTVPNITARTVTLATTLTGSEKYYWQVVTYTTVNGDSAVSGIASFTTLEDPPVIANPESKKSKVGGTVAFTVSATGLNLKYQWQKGTTNVTTGTGGTTANYTTAVVGSGDNGSTYRCIVSNNGGADTSAPAVLTIVYGVTYDGNGSTTGVVPTDSDSYASGDEVIVKTNSGSLARKGHIFAGWNSKVDGTGTNYTPGAGTLLMGSSDVTIYAKWTAESYSISYMIDGAAYSGTPASYTIETETFNLPVLTKTGYTFSGWYATPEPNGSPITSVTKGSTGNKVFYAKWTPNSYNITFDKNDAEATGSMSTQSMVFGTSANLIENGYTKNGYRFAGWATSRSGDLAFGNGALFTMTSEGVTLYARWKIIGNSVTYDANSATRGTAPAAVDYANGSTVTVQPNSGNLVKGNSSFAGWNTQADGKGITYACGATFPMGNGPVTLYAMYSGNTLMDNDGNLYTTVTIGTQVWLVENLKTTKYSDGTPIPNVTDSTAWSNLTTPGYCWYDNSSTYKEPYGVLYNWYTVNTGNLAPAGWHVPTDAEWAVLADFLGGATGNGGKLKVTGTEYWVYPNAGATNEYGFSAFPGGSRTYTGIFYSVGSSGFWWSANSVSYRVLNTNSSDFNRFNSNNKSVGFSVRCVRD